MRYEVAPPSETLHFFLQQPFHHHPPSVLVLLMAKEQEMNDLMRRPTFLTPTRKETYRIPPFMPLQKYPHLSHMQCLMTNRVLVI